MIEEWAVLLIYF